MNYESNEQEEEEAVSESSQVEARSTAVEVVDDKVVVEVLAPVMTAAQAQRCVEAIKNHAVSLRTLLVELDDRRGWEALGYSSMTACMVTEFKNSKPVLIRELKVGRIEKHHLQVPIGTYLESQLRSLSKLEPTQYKLAIEKAHKIAGSDKVSAVHVAKAVTEILNPTRVVKDAPTASKYKPGDLVRIKCALGALPEQKAWDGCWGTVQSTGSISCVVVLVGSKEIDYMAGDLDWDDNSDPKFSETCVRILNLWQQPDLEPVEENLLNFLQHRHFFSNLEVQMITLMEVKRS